MNMKKIILPSLLLAASTSVFAENQVKTSGIYVGTGYGLFIYNADENWDDSKKNGELVEDTDGDTFKIYGGYQFNRVIAIEMAYTDYGDASGYVYDKANVKHAVDQSPKSFSVAANAGYSFNNGLRPFALLGLSYMDLNSNYDFLDTNNPIAIKSGIGLEYSPAQLNGVQIRVALESDTYIAEAHDGLDKNDDLGVFSLSSLYAGVSYKF
ncbi:porin family protein [Psychromonas sp. RZ22]|uniref:porin family protein n=1 Tax=Psychromonas algarum TaxID=2555643 RepID=UPI0010684E5E|nr:porin family protein [Psychromonas sp. RZ22]TEW53210.1 porin family protein [Psychromonas sp. RZ22]